MWTIQAIKDTNHRAGFHYFEPETMRFFHSRVQSQVSEGPGGVFFVTSEARMEGGARKYTVRKFDPNTGEINTFGKFYELSRERALRYARIAACYPGAALEAMYAPEPIPQNVLERFGLAGVR